MKNEQQRYAAPHLSHRLLVRVGWTLQPRTPFIRSLGCGNHSQRSLESEVQHRLCRQLDLLTLSRRLHTATQATTGRGADGRALTTASNSADNRSDAGSCSNFCSRILASRRTLAAVLISLDVVVFAAYRDAVQLQRHH